MTSKFYYLKFGSGDPRLNSGLFPTFVIFSMQGLTSLSPPGITELPSGSGLYQFQFGATTAIAFLADGGSNLSAGDRYISGTLDPIQAVDQQIGFQTDSFGNTALDAATVWGSVKRLLEFFEGDSIYTKATGLWQLFNRGQTTLLRTKTLTNTNTSASKTGL